jgi:hypothetical protein
MDDGGPRVVRHRLELAGCRVGGRGHGAVACSGRRYLGRCVEKLRAVPWLSNQVGKEEEEALPLIAERTFSPRPSPFRGLKGL